MIARTGTRIELAAAAFLGLATLPCAQVTRAQTGENAPPAEVFKGNCSVCHGNDGAGSALGKRLKTPDLRSKGVHQKPTATLIHAITAGKDKMPPFGEQLSADQIKALVDYVRSLQMPSASK